MSVPMKLSENINVDRKKMGVNTIIAMTFQMRTVDAERPSMLRDGLAEAFITSIRKSDEELMR